MEKPMLFNTEMVQAILDGRKTTTRRIAKTLKDATKETKGDFKWECDRSWCNDKGLMYYHAPYRKGDILYVRETFKVNILGNTSLKIKYKADGETHTLEFTKKDRFRKISKFCDKEGWQPSLFMPKEAARIFLKVIDVRVERLQDIDYEGSKREGIKSGYDGWLGEWQYLWNSTVSKKDLGKYGFNANPYVWVIEFERIER